MSHCVTGGQGLQIKEVETTVLLSMPRGRLLLFHLNCFDGLMELSLLDVDSITTFIKLSEWFSLSPFDSKRVRLKLRSPDSDYQDQFNRDY